jgi:diguanylate cyclase (GGDEF)-like protein
LGGDSLQRFYPDLVRIGAEVRLPAGALLWKEGDPGDFVVVLLDGRLEVVHEGGEGEPVVLRTMESGSVVGELATADGRSRSATVRAREACRLLRIGAPEFRALLHERVEILEQLYGIQVDRVRSLTRQYARSRQSAVTDPLTRLYNFGFFRERLELEIARARHTGDLVSLVLLDVDHFKRFNDTNGHQAGNEALVRVAETIRGYGRRGDVVARFGGEEFVALLYGATRDEAAQFAEGVREAVSAAAIPGAATQPEGRLTVSAGVATFPWDGADADAVIKAADAGLYRAKEEGRNRVRCAAAAPPSAG